MCLLKLFREGTMHCTYDCMKYACNITMIEFNNSLTLKSINIVIVYVAMLINT